MATTVRIEGDQITLNDAASEETLRELVDLLSRQQGSSGSSNTAAGRQAKQTADNMKKAADNIKNASVKLEDVVETFDDIERNADKTFTEIGDKIGKELGQIAKNTGSVINDLVRGPASFETIGRALQSGSQQAGELMEEFAQGSAGAIPGIGALGTAAKTGAAVFGAGAMAAAAYAQNMADGFVALSQSGGNFNSDIVKTSAAINGLGLTMNSFTQIVQQNAGGLARYGGNVRDGTRAFTELAEVMRQNFGGELYSIGLRYEEQNETLAKFIAAQSRNTAFTNMSYLEQSQLYREYVSDLNRLVGLTGKNRQQLADELAQNQLRADANLRLSGATLEAQKAINMVFSTTGQDSAISQILMAGIAGKDLALEVAAGNTTIRDFLAGAPDVAERIRQLGDDVATGKISQETFLSEMAKVTTDIQAIGKEFQPLYGVNGVATVMTEAASGAQEFANQVSKIEPGTIGEKLETQADGVGGAITLFEASLTDVAGTIKQEVQNALSGFAAEMGLEGMDVGAKIQRVMNALDAIAMELRLFAADPLDYIMGGPSDSLKKATMLEDAGGLDAVLNSVASTNQGQAQAAKIIANASPDELQKIIADPGSLSSQVSTNTAGDITVDSDSVQAIADFMAAAKATNTGLSYTAFAGQLKGFRKEIPGEGTLAGFDQYLDYLYETRNPLFEKEHKALQALLNDFAAAGGNTSFVIGNSGINSPSLSYTTTAPFTIPERQYGGPVGMGNPYIVGERGAELFTPLTAGTITPSNELATAQGNMSILAKLDQLNSTMAQVAGNTGNGAQVDALNNQISTLRQLLGEAKRTYRVSRDLRNNTV